MRQSGEDMNQSAMLQPFCASLLSIESTLIAPNRPINGPFLVGLTHIGPTFGGFMAFTQPRL